jgi:hypothetical protein
MVSLHLPLPLTQELLASHDWACADSEEASNQLKRLEISQIAGNGNQIISVLIGPVPKSCGWSVSGIASSLYSSKISTLQAFFGRSI